MKLLVIEDSESEQKMLSAFLKESGFTSLSFVTKGEEGVELCSQEEFNFIVIDTVLPGIDGFETCRKIKEKIQGKDTKLIICTGQIDAVDAVKAREHGADEYCVKTADYQDLIDILKQFN